MASTIVETHDFQITPPPNLLLNLCLSFGLCFGVAWMGSCLTSLSLGSWYDTLAKPEWTPPGPVIGMIWAALFSLMTAATIILAQRSWSHLAVRRSMALHLSQLTLNVGWSACFFTLQEPALALAEIMVLIAVVGLTIRSFAKISRLAAGLLIPYLAWLCFAAYLNATIVKMNS
jgi:translocator protein